MEVNMMEVDFAEYCKLCKYKEKAGTEHPCDECLEFPSRDSTRKPFWFEEPSSAKK